MLEKEFPGGSVVECIIWGGIYNIFIVVYFFIVRPYLIKSATIGFQKYSSQIENENLL